MAREKLADVVPLSKPIALYVSPSNLCNLECIFCPHKEVKKTADFKPTILNAEKMRNIANNISISFGSVKHIKLTSAETLLNPEITEIVKICKTVADNVSLITNGVALNCEKADGLIEAGLDEIMISINGLSEEEYAANTGKALFNTVVENLRYLSTAKHRKDYKLHD
jgi:molybdenum cofactor biosynthesis enzyme MoaA